MLADGLHIGALMCHTPSNSCLILIACDMHRAIGYSDFKSFKESSHNYQVSCSRIQFLRSEMGPRFAPSGLPVGIIQWPERVKIIIMSKDVLLQENTEIHLFSIYLATISNHFTDLGSS